MIGNQKQDASQSHNTRNQVDLITRTMVSRISLKHDLIRTKVSNAIVTRDKLRLVAICSQPMLLSPVLIESLSQIAVSSLGTYLPFNVIPFPHLTIFKIPFSNINPMMYAYQYDRA